MAFIAWICSLICNFTCEFITVDVQVGGLAFYLGYGMWNYQGWSYLVQEGTIYYASTCNAYSDAVSQDAKVSRYIGDVR